MDYEWLTETIQYCIDHDKVMRPFEGEDNMPSFVIEDGRA